MSEQWSRLRSEDALELLEAFVHRIVEEEHLRALTIKGHTADRYGLRPPKVSADLDLLVEPVGFARLTQRLVSLGWQSRTAGDPHGLPHHSVSLKHPQWPVDIDIHDQFPGFFAPAAEVFEVLWQDRRTALRAGRSVIVPGAEVATILAILHCERNPRDVAAQAERAELERRIVAGVAPVDLGRLEELARATGCGAAVATSLGRLGAPIGSWLDPEEARRWAWLQDRYDPRFVGVSWWSALLAASWAKRPALVWRAIFPPAESIRMGAGRDLNRRAATGVRLQRWITAARTAPAAIGQALRH